MKAFGYMGIVCAALALALSGCATGAGEPSDKASGMRQGGTASELPDAKSRIVRGQVLQIEGSAYVVRERQGREVRLPVDQDTRMEHTPKVGDQIIAQVAEDGRTRSIRSATAGMP